MFAKQITYFLLEKKAVRKITKLNRKEMNLEEKIWALRCTYHGSKPISEHNTDPVRISIDENENGNRHEHPEFF